MTIDNTYLKKQQKLLRVLDINTIKVGDTLEILKAPRVWNSYFSPVRPMDILSFPCKIRIVELKNVIDNLIAIKCNSGCGWSLTSIIEAGCYKVN